MSQGHIYLIDDDAGVRMALTNLLESRGFTVFSFACADRFLAHESLHFPSCLILDLRMSAMDGLQLQEALGRKMKIPIIFISGHGDVPSTVKAMKAGAIEFLEKPIQADVLVEALKGAIAMGTEQKEADTIYNQLQDKYRTLTNREREVLPLVVGGFLNKQAAAHLNIADVTFEVHKRNLLKKMGAHSIAELVRIAASFGVQPQTPATFSSEAVT